MGEAGILTGNDRVELIQGEIVRMTPIGRRHAACVAELNRLLVPAVGDRAVLWPQNPVRLPRDTEPQPDIVLLRPRPDRYGEHDAVAEDVLLLIEVADGSLRYDRLVKLPCMPGPASPKSGSPISRGRPPRSAGAPRRSATRAGSGPAATAS